MINALTPTAAQNAPSKPGFTDEWEPTDSILWERVLAVARGDRREMTRAGPKGPRTIHAPNHGRGFRRWPSQKGSAWAVKQYKGFGGRWKSRKSIEASQYARGKETFMALLYTKLPHDTERLLTTGLSLVSSKIDEIDVEEWKHITLVYLGDDVPLATVAQAMVAAYEVVSTTPPFTVQINEITTFPKNDSGLTPVICRINSPEIHELQQRLCDVLDHYRIVYNKKFPEYKPHVTLGYTEGEFPDLTLSVPVSWGVHEVHLGAGDERDQRCHVTYPLRLEALTKRIASRYRELVGGRPHC